ncbi:MAG: type IV pilus modification protein PilV [Zoogloeaceae bacterium]|nr:type IV pilus modification protein PilV [Zoogloeaceae bacterium]
MRASNRIQQKGFTMIEVLITLVILTLGLLGLAGLQISSLKMGQSAGARSVASQYAYAMLDKIRSRGQAEAHHYICDPFPCSSGNPDVNEDTTVFLNQLKGIAPGGVATPTLGSLPNPTVKVYARTDAAVPADCRDDAGFVPSSPVPDGTVFVVCIAWDQGRDERLGIGDDPSIITTTDIRGDETVWAAGRLW